MEAVPITILQSSLPEEPEDFISRYLKYHSGGETPAVYSRWCSFSILGALLGRQCWVEHGSTNVHLNTYSMLIGTPGARKSTAIKSAVKILKATGYNNTSAERSTKEKFLLDLAGEDTNDTNIEDILDKNLFGSSLSDTSDYREMYIAADEFNDFIGNGNVEFISLLGSLWDFSGVYSNRIKNGKSVDIPNPTISILGGNTTTGFALAFPPEILGQGFFSRILMIYGEPNGKRIAFPKGGDPKEYESLVGQLRRIKQSITGTISRTPEATRFLEKIYSRSSQLTDPRFLYYYNRRFTHLLKLCGILTASRESTTITESDVLKANTYLTYAESFMPKALGEFGKSKHSEVHHKILQILDAAPTTVHSIMDLWKVLSTDMDKLSDLSDVLGNMEAAQKIQAIKTPKVGFLAKKEIIQEPEEGMVDFSLLTDEELNMRK